jgi:molybdopterin-guanine dinucleotide biosynthesis protein A
MIDKDEVTGVILAGGRGSRMGGVDKGLQNFRGMPMAMGTLMRLAPQVGEAMINANRNLSAYESFGVPVWPDSLADYAGPLAGFLTALEHCETPYLATVPCDTPLFPQDLVARLAEALEREDAEIAMAAARGEDGQFRAQPVFSLLRRELMESLVRFTHEGGRKIDAWTAQHRTVLVPFDRAGDDPGAFSNANTLAELHRLEQSP